MRGDAAREENSDAGAAGMSVSLSLSLSLPFCVSVFAASSRYEYYYYVGEFCEVTVVLTRFTAFRFVLSNFVSVGVAGYGSRTARARRRVRTGRKVR